MVPNTMVKIINKERVFLVIIKVFDGLSFIYSLLNFYLINTFPSIKTIDIGRRIGKRVRKCIFIYRRNEAEVEGSLRDAKI